MKKSLFFMVAVATLFTSCGEIESDINNLKDRIDQLEQKVPTIDEQIVAINNSIELLEKVDNELQAKDAQLEQADKNLEAKIAELKLYVTNELNSNKSWASATFATLEQYQSLLSEIVRLEALLKSNKEAATKELTEAIASLKTSLESWVNEQLTGYYTIAQTDAKIAELEQAIADGDEVFQNQIDDLKEQLASSNEEVTKAYQEAITKAITDNNGVINQQIANEIAAVNKRIDEEVEAINEKISKLQAQADENSAAIAKLLAQIQSLSYIPQTSDGKVSVSTVDGASRATLDFEVSPKDAVTELANVWQSAVAVKAVYTISRSVTLIDMPVVEFVADEANGIITVTASGENLSEEFYAGTQTASVRLSISDGNSSVVSDYIVMVAR
jgi:DNA repair exonuclease SbcCD ATPase subunit